MTKPSWQHQVLANLVVPLMRVKRNNTLDRVHETIRKAHGRPAPTPKAVDKRGVRALLSSHGGWPLWLMTPPGDPTRSIVAIHGGAYVYEIQGPHYGYYSQLAVDAGARVYVPLYPLAPEATATQVVPIMADLIQMLIGQYGADNVAVEGDSAGGGLALAAIQELLQRNTSVPSSLLLVSPWLDVTVPDIRSAEASDPLLDIEGLRECGRMWAGSLSTADWRVSPIHGQMSGLPRLAVYAGTRDVLFPDSLRLAQKAKEAGIEIDLDLREGLIHGWAMMTSAPEGAEVQKQIARLLFA